MNLRKVRVGDFLIRAKDLVPIERDKEYSLVTIKLYHKGVQLRRKELGANISAEKMSRIKAGQFILSGIDARHGAFGIVPPELDGAVVTNDFWHFELDESLVSKEYFLWLTTTPFFDDICKKASDGTTNRIRLQADRFFTQELAIPELAFQHEMVLKLSRVHQKAVLLQNELDHQLTLLHQLNQAILQEAVQGKLVAPAPLEPAGAEAAADEPASQLLQRIKAEKAQAGKKEKALPPIQANEITFEIPENWVWCRLGEVCDKIGSGSTPKGSNYVKEGYPFFRSQNIYNDALVYEDLTYISKEVHQQMRGTVVLAGDLLLNITGGSMGRCALVPNDFREGNVSQHVCIIRPIQLDNRFLHLMVLSPFFQKYIFSSTTGAGREGLPKYNLEQFVVPLPPLAEQKRILAEVEKQLAHTQQLKAQVLANQQATGQLLKALLKEAFGG